MQVECYRKNDKVKEEGGNKDEKRKILCKELGLLKQARVTECENIGDYYPAMTKEELFVWSDFLPTFYSKGKKEWKKYDFDIVPDKVLEEISIADSLKIFTDLEIWTSEKNIDPYAVGLVGSRGNKNVTIHGITRWGECLKSFSEVKRRVLNAYQKKERETIPEIAQEYMDKYTISQKDLPQWNNNIICFKGSAFFKSNCCKTMAYKFEAEYSETHLVCSKCGKVKIKQHWGI